MNQLLPRLRQDFAAAEARRLELAAIDPDDVPRQQLEKFRSVWADAVSDVPYYASLVAAGRAPATIATWADFRSIPELCRETLQTERHRFQRNSAPPDGFAVTGGSMAAPLQLGMSRAERDLMRIVKVGAWQSMGYGPASRLFLLWGHGHLLGTGWRRAINRTKRRLSDAVLRYRRVDAYRLSRDICLDYAEQILQFRPVGVIGYAAALDLLARYAQPYRDRLRASGVKFVLSTSEPPPRPDSIDVIEDLFGCPMVQEYGGVDIGQVAFKHGRMPFEVYPDLNYLECSEGGSALVTSLYRRYTPLVRYRVGDDLEQPERLGNGHVMRFTAVAGRVNDIVMMNDGSAVYGLSVLHCAHQEQAVHNIQLVMTDGGAELHAVVRPGADRGAIESRIKARLSELHPTLAAARFRYVDDVATTVAGKRRWVVDRRAKAPA